jgi:hypothetical protein
MFSGIKEAKRGFTSNFLRAGKYVLRIDSCQTFDSDNGEFWKNTFTVLAVIDGGTQPHKVGEVVHVMWNYGGTAEKHQIFQRNLKKFIGGVLDVSDESIDEANCLRISGQEQAMGGLVTIVTGHDQPSKKSKDEKGNPKMFTNFSWTPCMDKDEIVAAIGEEAFKVFFPTG